MCTNSQFPSPSQRFTRAPWTVIAGLRKTAGRANICPVLIALICGALTCWGQTNTSQFKLENATPALANAESKSVSPQSVPNLLVATDRAERIAPKPSSPSRKSEADLQPAPAETPISGPFTASEGLMHRWDSKQRSAGDSNSLQGHTVLAANQFNSGIDDKHLAEFQRFDEYWTPPPSTAPNGIQRAVRPFFWIDPNIETSPVGFSGSQLWERTLDPRTTVWTTPRIVTQ